MADLSDCSAHELLRLFRTGEASPVEALEAALSRAQRSQGTVNAFCALATDTAMEAARQSAQRWVSGTPVGLLDGVPVSVKDNVSLAGMPTWFGSLATLPGAGAPAPDSPAVQRLREHGAVLFGKTTLPDFAHKIVTDSPRTGVTRNPWHLDHTPGGSSGGAAAAIAVGAGPLAVGTDGGGSIRIPAAFCGIFGFKPSFGRVPHHPRGAFAPLSHVGPMARTVADAALMMEVIARPDARDWYALPYDGARYTQTTAGQPRLRVALSRSLGLDALPDAATTAALECAAAALAAQGAEVTEADPPCVQACHEVHRRYWMSLSAHLRQTLGEEAARLDPSLLLLADLGERIGRAEFVEAMLERGQAGSRVGEFFQQFDVVLCPVHTGAAPALGGWDALSPPVPVYTPWCNQLGLPAASVPAGLDASGLPLAVQVVAGPHRDAVALQAAQAVEAATAFDGRPQAWHADPARGAAA